MIPPAQLEAIRPMQWCVANRADPAARRLADRHYNRQKHGAPQFAPTGSCLVLLSECGKAFWITSAPLAEYVKHRWAGAWICSAFRSEGAGRASDLIRNAIAATRSHYGDPPSIGMVTFIDPRQVKPIMVHGEMTWGRTWRLAGFSQAGTTKGGLIAMQLLPERMPAPSPALPRSPLGLPLWNAA
jgi:hypothetical protein